MKKTLFTLMLALATLVGMAQSWNALTSSTPSSIQTSLLYASESKTAVRLQVPGFLTTSVNTPRGEAQIVSVPKTVSTAAAGEPHLPMIAVPVLIGDQQHYAVRVIDAQYADFPMEVAPSKGDFSRQINPEDVPFTYGPAYNNDAFFPDQRADLYDPYIVRDFRGQNMVVYPFAYNPATHTLRVYYDLTVELYDDFAVGQNTMTRTSNTVKMDNEFKSIYEHRFINFQAAMNRYTPINENGHLLIICHDAFMDAMQPYVAWKKQIGIPTTMVGTSVTGITPEALMSYIQQQFAQDPSIAHILLVGDSQHINGYYANYPNYAGRSDNWYGQLVGDDRYNDVIVGRFSAETADHVTTQVNKVIQYERDINASDTWLTTGTGVATTAGSGGHFNEDDWQHVDNLRTDLLGYHYSEVYRDYPTGGGASSNASTLSQHINNGLSIINYCNHGSETGWGVFNYSNSNVNALTNVYKLPIVWSVACLVGKYDYYQPCFGETWLRANNSNNVEQPTGAIGGMFSYISQPWVPPMYGQDEMVDVLVENYATNHKCTLGGVSYDGNMKIIDQYGQNNAAGMGTYMCWILYGDPTLTLRNDVPTEMTLDYAPALNMGATAFEVSGTNAEGARATLTVDGEILGSAVINNGSALLEFDAPGQPGLATLTVFGYNKITYIATLPIVTGADDEPVNVAVSASPTIIPRGSSTTLNAQATGGNWYFQYNWTPAEGLDNPHAKSPVANPTTTTTYTCTVNSGSYSNADSVTVTVVCPPSDLTATAEGNSIVLNWSPAEPADSYNLYRTSVLIAEGLTETTYTDANLNPGNYSYRVATVYQGIVSPKSSAAAASIAAPLSVTATANPAIIPFGATVTLTATPSSGNGTCSYQWTPAETVSDPTAATTTATPATTTTYTVTVSRNNETATAEATVQVVTAPTALTATLNPTVGNEVTLTWEAAALADTYQVFDNNQPVQSNLTAPQCTVGNLTNGNHCFTVRAVFQGVTSPASDEACVEVDVCLPPEDFTATYHWEDNEFGTLLVWQKNQNANLSLDRFYIYRGTDPNNISEPVAYMVNIPYTYHYQYFDTEVEPGTYWYCIVAVYGEDTACASEPLQVTVTDVDEATDACKVYPIPATERVTIEAAGMRSIRLVNSLGQTVYQSAVEEDRLDFDVSPFGKGVFLLLIQNDQMVVTRTLIIK
ncbi:MAG: T9SS type A sorting domain-containing protein [Bacteroidales bacterium]|nr:T9SS type A sorting domain-containing protein [Bacteroidales bacterium]